MAFVVGNFGAVTDRFGTPSDFYPTYWIYNSGADNFATVAAAHYFNTALSTYTVNTGDKVSVSTSTSNLAFSGTFSNDGAGNLSINWDRTYFLDVPVADISGTSSTTYFGRVPVGIIVEVSGVIANAVTVASANITFAIAGTGITGGGFAVTVMSSGAGILYTAVPTALNVIGSGNTVSVTSDGSSTTACAMIAGLKIICPTEV